MTKKMIKPTSEVDFKPTPHMRLWLDTSIEISSESPKIIAEASGIDRTNWWKWLKQPGFENWYFTEYDRKIRRLKPLVDALGVRFARRGSPQHFEYLAKRVGNLSDAPNESPILKIVVTREGQ